jgi:hypothetical protein
MHQVVEFVAIFIDTAGSLLQLQEFLLFVAHEARQNMVITECSTELTP